MKTIQIRFENPTKSCAGCNLESPKFGGYGPVASCGGLPSNGGMFECLERKDTKQSIEGRTIFFDYRGSGVKATGIPKVNCPEGQQALAKAFPAIS